MCPIFLMQGLILVRTPVFPQGVLSIIPLIEGVVGADIPRACAGYESGLPLCSMSVIVLLGTRSAPQLLD